VLVASSVIVDRRRRRRSITGRYKPTTQNTMNGQRRRLFARYAKQAGAKHHATLGSTAASQTLVPLRDRGTR